MERERPAEAGVALVTGASRGIGRVIALRLADAGHAVAVNFRTGAEEAERTVAAIQARGGHAVAVRADMSDPAQAVGLHDTVATLLGDVRVLVNNAGITRDRLVVQMSVEDWDVIWHTDLVGARALLKRTAARMCATGGGRIINLSSVVGSAGNAGQANYAAAKAAIQGLTREAAVRYAAHGITVNCIVPGYFETDATSHLTAEQAGVWMERIPAGRFGDVEDIAELTAFLAGGSAGYLTGQCIAVDGGFLASQGFGVAS